MTVEATRPSATRHSTSTGQGSSRIAGIDGLRAFAALWVVLFHIGASAGGQLWPGVDFVVRSGSIGVSLFLVLSGLCLYLPYAGGRHSRFSSGDFFSRRVRRLLPAYLVSLVLILGLNVAAAGRLGLPALSGQDVVTQTVTHVTMTHQFFPDTFYGLNGAYWSLGLEWELYLTLPLLVFAAARFGVTKVVIGVFAITATYRLGLYLVGQAGVIDPNGVWSDVVLTNFFLGRWSEFALGMLAAEWLRTRGTRVRWPLVAASVLAAVVALTSPGPFNHILYGVVFFTLVSTVLAGNNVVAAAFSWRPLVAVGVFSYSLYLLHGPVIAVLGYLLRTGVTDDPRQVFLLQVALLPVTLAAALALFALVERHSLSGTAPAGGVRQLLFPDRHTAWRARDYLAVAPTPAAVPAVVATPTAVAQP